MCLSHSVEEDMLEALLWLGIGGLLGKCGDVVRFRQPQMAMSVELSRLFVVMLLVVVSRCRFSTDLVVRFTDYLEVFRNYAHTDACTLANVKLVGFICNIH